MKRVARAVAGQRGQVGPRDRDPAAASRLALKRGPAPGHHWPGRAFRGTPGGARLVLSPTLTATIAVVTGLMPRSGCGWRRAGGRWRTAAGRSGRTRRSFGSGGRDLRPRPGEGKSCFSRATGVVPAPLTVPVMISPGPRRAGRRRRDATPVGTRAVVNVRLLARATPAALVATARKCTGCGAQPAHKGGDETAACRTRSPRRCARAVRRDGPVLEVGRWWRGVRVDGRAERGRRARVDAGGRAAGDRRRARPAPGS